MKDLVKILDLLKTLQFNDPSILQLEQILLTLIKNEYGKESEIYKKIFNLTQQGFWRPEKGDPRGSASCPRLYQREYNNHILTYYNLLKNEKILIV